jgi:hypothetical protein
MAAKGPPLCEGACAPLLLPPGLFLCVRAGRRR